MRDLLIVVLGDARRHLLAKKYFLRWKSNAWRNDLNRRAKNRRQIMAKTINRENQMRIRVDNDLKDILGAQREKERVQEEQRMRTSSETIPTLPLAQSRPANGVQQGPEAKRKSTQLEGSENPLKDNRPRKIARGHGRSRTIGNSNDFRTSIFPPTPQAKGSIPSPSLRSSIFYGRSILQEPNRSQNLRRSLSGRKVDTTGTDYFRLKAMGIDPETPIVPDTKSTLEHKKRRREEEISNLSLGKRASIMNSMAVTSPEHATQPTSTQSGTFGSRKPITASGSATGISSPAPKPVSATLNDEDELLRQIREARAVMSEQQDWFKTQTVQLEKEVEEQGELRRSASRVSSTDSPHPSTPGLAMANGYEYLPARGVPGHSLSRTEQRIRRTGAHGLATRPIGGSSDYLAVAMSRKSAAKLTLGVPSQQKSQAVQAAPTAKRNRMGRRKTGEKDSEYILDDSDEDSGELGDERKSVLRHRRAKPNHRQKQPTDDPTYRYAELDGNDEECENDEDEEEVLEEERAYSNYGQYESIEGETADLYEDDGPEEDESEEEEEEEEEEGEEDDALGELPRHQLPQQAKPEHGLRGGYFLRSSTTPERGFSGGLAPVPSGGAQMMSRATSGTGASADDAFVLDSD